MARTQELFSIGDVAQLFHLSVSSLRHYETIGLLTPEYTDPATGYRYYGPWSECICKAPQIHSDLRGCSFG